MRTTEFKTGAWVTKQSADTYHKSTTEAASLFTLVREEQYLRYIQLQVAPGSKILDLGCGTGIISVKLHDLGYQVVACDVSPGMLEKLREVRGDRKFEIRQGSGFRIPAADNEFDAVISRMFIQHFPDWQNVLQEKARATRNGGKVLFDFANREHVEAYERDFAPVTDFPYSTDASDASRHYAVAGEAEMTKIAENCGLSVVQIAPFGLLLYNLFLWRALGGTAGVRSWEQRLHEILNMRGGRELMLLLEGEVLPHLPKTTSYGNMIILAKGVIEEVQPPALRVQAGVSSKSTASRWKLSAGLRKLFKF